jgi:hypothetical protein
MQPRLKRIITLGSVAGIATMALLAIFLTRWSSPPQQAEVSQPLSAAASPGQDPEANQALLPSSQEAWQETNSAISRDRRASRKATSSTLSPAVVVEHEEVADSFVPVNETFDPAPVYDTAVPVVPPSAASESSGGTLSEPHGDQSVVASADTTPAAPEKRYVSKYSSGRASTLLAEIRAEGAPLRLNAETLGTFARNRQLSWQTHAAYLTRVKDHINAVGHRIAELQRMRDDVHPWQQQAIADVTSHAAQVAASTQAAIVHLRESRNRLFVSEYRDHLTTIAARSADMKQTVDKFLDYEKAQQKFQQLQNELELASD